MRTLLLVGTLLLSACSSPASSGQCTIPENRPEGHSDDLIQVHQPIGYECVMDEECVGGDTSRWKFPDQVRCEDHACVECTIDAECGEVGTCRYGTCTIPPTCVSGADCALGPANGPRQACIDGYCQTCSSDDDCEGNEICWQSRYEEPAMCIPEDKIDPACVNHTCGTWCQGWDRELQLVPCRPNVPEADDYEQSCARDSDCVSFDEEYWDRASCDCHCFAVAVSECAAEAYAEDRADTRTLYGCEDAPDCSCPSRTARCDGGRCVTR